MQTYLLSRLEEVMIKKLKEIGSLDLFENSLVFIALLHKSGDG